MREFIKKHPKFFCYFSAFMLPFTICLLICAGNGVYPFGDRCILHVDMYHQYCPFFTEFLDKIRSGGSLMYSWTAGLGSDFVSLYAYYLASPLNWLIVLCPRDYVIEFMTLLVLVKIGGCGLTFYSFLKYKHQDRDGVNNQGHSVREELPAIVFSSAYALSGFVAAYNWNIMWMDSVALMPLAAFGLLRMVREKKPGLYYVSLAAAIFSNYYISIMICMFLCLYFVLLLAEERRAGRSVDASAAENGKGAGSVAGIKDVGRFVFYSLLAGGTSAVLLIPEMKILGYSGSAGISWPDFENYFHIIPELSRVCTTAAVYTGNSHWPNLYAGAFCLVLAVLYVLNREISWKQKIPRVFMLVFFLASFSNSWLDFVWHGLHFPDSLPGRQSFLYIFVVLAISYETVRHWRGIRPWHPPVAIAVWAAVLAASFFMTGEDVTDSMAIVITGVLVICYGLLAVMICIGNERERRMLCPLACGLALCELALNMGVTSFSTTSRTLYLQKMEDYGQLLAEAEDGAGEEFYRVEDTQRKTKNDSALYDYPSATQFSSLMNIDVSHFYQSVYMEGGKNFYCYNGATPVLSAMLSVKYMLSDSDMEEGALCRLAGQCNGQYLYENTYCLPLGYIVPEDLEGVWSRSNDKISNINQIGHCLGADGNILTETSASAQENAGSTTMTVMADGYYYAAYQKCSSDSLTVTTSKGFTKKYSKTTHRYLISFGYLHAGESVTVSNSNKETVSFRVYLLNLDAVDAAYGTLAGQTMELSDFSDTKIAGTIDVKTAGRLLFSIPNEEGWTLYVDGKAASKQDFWETFISVPLSEGEHAVELRYRTPGLLVGAIVSAGSLFLFVLAMIIRKNAQKK